MTTRQCYLEETNYDHPESLELEVKEAESMTVFLWILSPWYAQRDTAITQVMCVTLQRVLSKYTEKRFGLYFNHILVTTVAFFCVCGTRSSNTVRPVLIA